MEIPGTFYINLTFKPPKVACPLTFQTVHVNPCQGLDCESHKDPFGVPRSPSAQIAQLNFYIIIFNKRIITGKCFLYVLVTKLHSTMPILKVCSPLCTSLKILHLQNRV